MTFYCPCRFRWSTAAKIPLRDGQWVWYCPRCGNRRSGAPLPSKVIPPTLSVPATLYALLDRDVDDLELTIRAANGLLNGNIHFVGQLVQKTPPELLRIKNFGRFCLKDIQEALADLGLSLNMSADGWKPPIPEGAR